ncbi:hypothetical protein M404DRAFT_1008768 [Pisolithus tinctorius Marx 270]|uniref:Uncharacterized protein n=1 Tax=Pisolithus tinctorius Marx 270 TaxID=870435 RepID=A0A0C3MXX7_PISTI|nr:hypothetical protein M404DRAFT_1008768 [Pisolithus tinctorius Marx 270]
MDGNTFSDLVLLSYLGLPLDYSPLPSNSPVEFLRKFLHQIPPHLITSFGLVTTPKQRSLIPEMRNRRLRYTETAPKQLELESAKARWPHLWSGRERYGKRAAEDEKEWASKNFLDGVPQQVGKLGSLLGEYEEEREAERVRYLKCSQGGGEEDEFIPEEDESDSDMSDTAADVQESPEELSADFARRIKELFVYDSSLYRVLIMTCVTGANSMTLMRTRRGGLTRRRRTRWRWREAGNVTIDKYGNISVRESARNESGRPIYA